MRVIGQARQSIDHVIANKFVASSVSEIRCSGLSPRDAKLAAIGRTKSGPAMDTLSSCWPLSATVRRPWHCLTVAYLPMPFTAEPSLILSSDPVKDLGSASNISAPEPRAGCGCPSISSSFILVFSKPKAGSMAQRGGLGSELPYRADARALPPMGAAGRIGR